MVEGKDADNPVSSTTSINSQLSTFVLTYVALSLPLPLRDAQKPSSLNYSLTSSKKICLAISTFFASITCESLIICTFDLWASDNSFFL